MSPPYKLLSRRAGCPTPGKKVWSRRPRQTDGCAGAVSDALRYPPCATGRTASDHMAGRQRPSPDPRCASIPELPQWQGRRAGPGGPSAGERPSWERTPRRTPRRPVFRRPARWEAGWRPARHSPRSWTSFPTLAGRRGDLLGLSGSMTGSAAPPPPPPAKPAAAEGLLLRPGAGAPPPEARQPLSTRHVSVLTHRHPPSHCARRLCCLGRPIAESWPRSASNLTLCRIGKSAVERQLLVSRRYAAAGRLVAFPTSGRSAGRNAAVLGTRPGACADQPFWTAVSSMGTAIASTTTFPIVICLLSASVPG